MKTTAPAVKVLMLAFSFLFFLPAVKAQELKIQKASVRAPDNLKIDGKINEWGKLFPQAHNPDIRVYYTLANDDKNLYLLVLSQGQYPNKKITLGGMSLIISHSLDKKKRINVPDNVNITFPVTDRQKATIVNTSLDKYFNNWSYGKRAAHKAQIDSLQTAINTQAENAFNEIKVIGIKDVDTIISIYNTVGIKAAAGFNNDLLMICELAIPLKYLGLDPANPTTFSYAIRLNGTRLNNYTDFSSGSNAPSPIQSAMVMDQMSSQVITNPTELYMIDPKEFWAEYTLAKKE